jgi:TPR repeat protein/peptidoglycan hydrolase-like protein with peptidoglycan-binding domain
MPHPLAALYRRAEAGDTEAMVDLARRYFRGDGLPADRAEGATWLIRAAEAGDHVAQFNVGILYEHGLAVPHRAVAIDADPARAADWYARAAEGGLALAQHNLALLYRTGRGVPRDRGRAASLLQRAARQGTSVSMLTLGEMHEQGDGLPRDPAVALGWYQLAQRIEQGQQQTSSLLPTLNDRVAALQKELGPEARQRADRLAADELRAMGSDQPPASPSPAATPPAAPSPSPAASVAAAAPAATPDPPPPQPPAPSPAAPAAAPTPAAVAPAEPPARHAPPASPAVPPAQVAAATPVAPEPSKDVPEGWPAESRAQVEAIQKLLGGIGLYGGPIDGKVGAATRTAAREAQRRAGLRQTGEPSPELYVYLRRQPAARAAPQAAAPPAAAPAAAAAPAPPAPPEAPADPAAEERRRQVEAAQRLLRGLGLYNGGVDGRIGRNTRNAIREFERRMGAPETGEPSPELIATLRRQTRETLPPVREQPPEAAAPAAAAPPAAAVAPGAVSAPATPGPAAPPAADPQVARTQELLQGLGYYHGGIDGRLTTNLRVAIVAFQKDAGLPETGDLTAATYDALQRRGGRRGR